MKITVGSFNLIHRVDLKILLLVNHLSHVVFYEEPDDVLNPDKRLLDN